MSIPWLVPPNYSSNGASAVVVFRFSNANHASNGIAHVSRLRRGLNSQHA